MAQSIDINLPKSQSARFPDRCVVCDGGSPDSHVRLMTGSIGWWTWLLWGFGKPFVVKAPACTFCAWKLHGLRLTGLLSMIVVMVAALWLIWPHFKEFVPRGLQPWAMMALILVCLIPQICWKLFFAEAFDITAFSESVDYEFTSHDYAMEFAVANSHAAWVKVNGNLIVWPGQSDPNEPDDHNHESL